MSISRWLASIFGLTLGFTLIACSPEPDNEVGDDESTGPAEPCAVRPDFPELYSSCAGAATCGVSGYTCASQSGMDPEFNEAFCTGSCTMDAECPSIDGCSAIGLCYRPTGGGTGVCVLECDEGKQCPDNMQCLEDETNGVISYFCF